MKLTFLGTSSGAPTKDRNVSSMVLQYETGECSMFDCGEGTQHQLQKSDIKAGKITSVMITHLHGDHGLPGMLCSISGGNPVDRTTLYMYGPIGLAMLLKTNFELSDSHLAFKLRIFEFVPPEIEPEDLKVDVIKTELITSSFIFYDEKKSCYTLGEHIGVSGVTILAAPILHRVFTVGYVIQEETKVGKLDVEKLKKTGIKPGPLFSKIKNKEDGKMEDGTMIYWRDYIGDDIIGRKIVILGDTYDPRGIARIADRCDAITHESTLDDDDSVSCIEKGHSTPKMAATFAESIKAKRLILTHYSARYAPLVKEKDDDRVSISLLRDQAKKIFENVDMAEDFKTFEFKREK